MVKTILLALLCSCVLNERPLDIVSPSPPYCQPINIDYWHCRSANGSVWYCLINTGGRWQCVEL